MKSIKVLMAALMMVAFSFASCSKDEDTGVAEGKMTSTIDGKSADFTIGAYTYKGTTTSGSYEYLIVSGTSGTTQADMKSFVVTVYGSKLEAKKYVVPTYTQTYNYDYLEGFSMGVYMPNIATTADYYYSLMVAKSAGSVTISSISATNVKGSYDMTLVNSKDNSKTMTLKGEFNAKITTLAGK
jgi:hypothetical protein